MASRPLSALPGGCRPGTQRVKLAPLCTSAGRAVGSDSTFEGGYMRTRLTLAILGALALSACEREAPEPQAAEAASPSSSQSVANPGADRAARSAVHAAVNSEPLRNADAHPRPWMRTGRDYREQHYSPLDSINPSNVNELALTWYTDIPTKRGQESTPLVI